MMVQISSRRRGLNRSKRIRYVAVGSAVVLSAITLLPKNSRVDEHEGVQHRPDVPRVFGLETIVDEKYSVGEATLGMFLGSWEPQVSSSNQSICPHFAAEYPKFSCNYTNRETKKYIARGLKPFDGHVLTRLRPIVFVGDSLSEQMYQESMCLLEYQRINVQGKTSFLWIKSLLASDIAFELPDIMHVRIDTSNSETAKQNVYGSWMDRVIEIKASYVIINTGAWWNPYFFRWKLDWCDYESWPELTLEDLVMAYELTLRQVLLPMLQELWEEHGIRAIWRDVAPAGLVDENGSTISDFPYHTLVPKFNEIGREVVSQAGGYIMPVWFLSYLRQDDHMLDDTKSSTTDRVHWCAYHGTQSVPAVWNSLLYNVIVDDVHQTRRQKSASVLPSESKTQRNKERIAYLYSELYAQFQHHKAAATGKKSCSCEQGSNFVHCTANDICVWDNDRCTGSKHT